MNGPNRPVPLVTGKSLNEATGASARFFSSIISIALAWSTVNGSSFFGIEIKVY